MLALTCLLAGCGGDGAKGGGPTTAQPGPRSEAAKDTSKSCPTAPVFEEIAPGVRPEQLHADYWIARLTPREASRELLEGRNIRELNAALISVPGAYRDVTDDAIAETDVVRRQLEDRLAWIGGRVDSAKYVEGEAGSFARAEAIVEGSRTMDEYRLVVDETPLFCIPLDTGLYKEPIDRAFDRNRCASLHPGEQIRVLRQQSTAEESEPWIYVHAGHSVGWIRGATLTPPLSDDDFRRFRDEQPRLMVIGDDALEGRDALRFGTHFPLARPPREDGPYEILDTPT
jgi:hypothetical protein